MAHYEVAPIAINPVNGLLAVAFLECCPQAQVTHGEGKRGVLELGGLGRMVELCHQQPDVRG